MLERATGGKGQAAKLFAALVVGVSCGAGVMYSYTREPAPIITRVDDPIVVNVGARPVPEPVAPPVAPTESRPAATEQVVTPPAAADPAPAPEPKTAPVERPAPTIARRLNINTATAAELELLPEVGPKLAAAIVRYREINGPFKSVVDLDHVKGVGSKTLAKLAPLVSVEDPLP